MIKWNVKYIVYNIFIYLLKDKADKKNIWRMKKKQIKDLFHYVFRYVWVSRKITGRWVRCRCGSSPLDNCTRAKLWGNVRLTNYPPALTYKQRQTCSHCCLALLCLSICGIHVTLVYSPRAGHLSPDEATDPQAQLQRVAVAPCTPPLEITERIRT